MDPPEYWVPEGALDVEEVIINEWEGERFGLPPYVRTAASSIMAFSFCGILGIFHGSRSFDLRFRAENAHRLPTTEAGWLLYHREKNLHKFLAACKEGRKFAFKVIPWVVIFNVLEESFDYQRFKPIGPKIMNAHQDFVSTTFAGLSTSAIFSLWNRLPMQDSAKIAKAGLLGGLSFGLFQDAIHLSQGHHLAYVDNVRSFFGGRSKEPQETHELK